VYRLNEVFADKEPACAERWAGAYPFTRIRLVYDIQQHGNRCFRTLLPAALE
jgi:hypothetical protein